MRKTWLLLLLVLCLTGCSEAEVFETVDDEVVLSVMSEPREIRLSLPEETVLPAMETDSGTLYLCGDYDVMLQTLESGDLDRSIRQVSGYEIDDLTVITTAKDDLDCYEFVWTSTSEGGEQVCRGMILDDGDYHYILTAMADADMVYEYQEIWNGIFESFSLI